MRIARATPTISKTFLDGLGIQSPLCLRTAPAGRPGSGGAATRLQSSSCVRPLESALSTRKTAAARVETTWLYRNIRLEKVVDSSSSGAGFAVPSPSAHPAFRHLEHHRPGVAVRVLRRSSLTLERRHVDGEAVLHIRGEHALVGLVDLLDRDHLDIGGDAVLAAEVEHLLGLGDAADQ
jgi:hypothetical protein